MSLPYSRARVDRQLPVIWGTIISISHQCKNSPRVSLSQPNSDKGLGRPRKESAELVGASLCLQGINILKPGLSLRGIFLPGFIVRVLLSTKKAGTTQTGAASSASSQLLHWPHSLHDLWAFPVLLSCSVLPVGDLDYGRNLLP